MEICNNQAPIKSFEINQCRINDDETKVDYLLNVLKVWNHKITNRNLFFKFIGFKIESHHIDMIIQSIHLYESTVLENNCKVIHRLINELNIHQLSTFNVLSPCQMIESNMDLLPSIAYNELFQPPCHNLHHLPSIHIKFQPPRVKKYLDTIWIKDCRNDPDLHTHIYKHLNSNKIIQYKLRSNSNYGNV
eukprot:298725_1